MPAAAVPGKQRPSPADVLIAVACALAVTSTAFALLALLAGHNMAGTRDFVIYWATGQQLVHHGNPWSAAAIRALEHSAGFIQARAFYMRNPPWSLPLALPLGYVSARVAALPWSLFLVAVLVYSVQSLWKIFPRPRTPIDWIGYCFPPALIGAAMGQTSPLLLLGLVLFLRFHASHPLAAGAALWFCTLKPHVFLPFAAALLLWIVVERAWRVAAGLLLALAATSLVATLIDPRSWIEYLQWARSSGISHELIPCLAVVFRDSIDSSAEWLAFVPALLACVWAAAYYWRRRRRWNWLDDGGLLMLVSLVVAPYCWINDQCLALPALLLAASRTRSQLLLAGLGAACFAIEIQVFATNNLGSWLYLWPAPAWLAWLLLARREPGVSHEDPRPALA